MKGIRTIPDNTRVEAAQSLNIEPGIQGEREYLAEYFKGWEENRQNR